jgi:hypothetical protein
MEKLYVHEVCPNGEVSTVGLFYSRTEAENVIAQLQGIPEKNGCRYEISDALPVISKSRSRKATQSREE